MKLVFELVFEWIDLEVNFELVFIKIWDNFEIIFTKVWVKIE